MKIKKDTIIRTIILALALMNQIMSASGRAVLPISDEQVEALVSTGATVLAAVWAWWKNNSLTKDAIAADAYLDALRKKDEED